jgi:isoleucyl-tRNA synthetase
LIIICPLAQFPKVKGKDLEGLRYLHPLMDEVPKHRDHKGQFDHAIICGEHVTLEEGTGCVHTAPAHGPEDFEIAKERIKNDIKNSIKKLEEK